MRRTGMITVGAILAALASACSTTGTGHGVSISPVTPNPTPIPTPVESPTASPSPSGPLQIGGASIVLSGGLTSQVSFPTLVAPTTWGVPPAAMDLTWAEPTGQQLSLSGTAFVSRATTSPERILSFLVTGTDGPVEFRSESGECSVTITPALLDNMGGLFTCPTLTDVSGTFTVNARGTFSATG